jgi:hypothetical protein
VSTGRPEQGRDRDRLFVVLAVLLTVGIVALVAGAFLIGHALVGWEFGVGLAAAVGGLLAVVAALRLDVL